MAEDGLPPLQQVLPREDPAVGQTGAHPGDPGACLASTSQFFQSTVRIDWTLPDHMTTVFPSPCSCLIVHCFSGNHPKSEWKLYGQFLGGKLCSVKA